MIAASTQHPQSRASSPTPNEIAHAMTGRPHVTYSEVRSFQSCPLKWKYQYVDRVMPERLSAAMLLGSGIHAAVELHFESLLAAVPPPDVDRMMVAFQTCWETDAVKAEVQYSRGQDESAIMATARRMLEEFAASPLADPLGEIVGVEESFKVHLGDDLPSLAGRVDMITLDRQKNELTITDFKTARSVWSQANAIEQSDQLVLYAQGCESIARDFGADVTLRYVVVTKTKQPKIDAITVPYDRSRVLRSQAIIRQVFSAMKVGSVYPVPSPMNCSTCSFVKRCAHWHRHDRM